MGQRTNYVLVEGGGWRLHYSHWGANRLDVDLLDGPASTTRFIRAQHEVERDDWLDDVWCEGAALVDHDARQLLLFTIHLDGFAHRTALLAVLARTWPGWEIRWAYDGLEDIAAHVGVDRAVVRTAGDGPGGGSAAGPRDMGPLAPAEPDEHDFAVSLSVVDEQGARGYALWVESVLDLLHRGPGLVREVPREARLREFGAVPQCGVHVDRVRRTVAARTGENLEGQAGARALPGWDGWRWTFWQDEYAAQERASAGAVVFPAVDLAGAVRELTQRFDRLADKDPVASFRAVHEKILQQDPGARPSPWTEAHTVTGPLPGERAALRAVLAALGGVPDDRT